MSLLLFLTTADRAGPSSGGNWAFLGFELIFIHSKSTDYLPSKISKILRLLEKFSKFRIFHKAVYYSGFTDKRYLQIGIFMNHKL